MPALASTELFANARLGTSFRRRAAIFMGGLAFASLPVFAQPCLCDSESFSAWPTTFTRVNTTRVPFIERAGKPGSGVLYSARTFGGTVLVQEDGRIAYRLSTRKTVSDAEIRRSCTLAERTVGGRAPVLNGENRSATSITVFRGQDGAQRPRNVPAFHSVCFGEVYDGIRLHLSAFANNVEKIFTLAPEADPRAIRLAVEGARSLEVTAEGELAMATDLGPVMFTKPVAYQETDGIRTFIEAGYRVEGLEYGFHVGTYDAARPLVIDPLLSSTYIGGSEEDGIQAMVTDEAGRVIVVGNTFSDDYPTTSGVWDDDYSDDLDVFVSIFSPDLSTLLASAFLGGEGWDEARAVALDGDGNIYITGTTDSGDFPVTPDAFQTTLGNWGNGSAFVTRLDPALTNIQASTYLGGLAWNNGRAIQVDTGGNVFVAGATGSASFPTTTGAHSATYRGFGPWTNYTLAARVKLMPGSELSLVFCDSDLGHYQVNLNADDTLGIGKWDSVKEEWTPLGGTNDIGISAGTWQDVEISAVNGFIQVRLDGAPALAAHDASAPILPGGRVALMCSMDDAWPVAAEVYVDDLQVIGTHGVLWFEDFEEDDAVERWDVSVWGEVEPPGWQRIEHEGQFSFYCNIADDGGSWALSRALNLEQDGFVARLNGDLTELQAATFLGGLDWDEPNALSLGRDGRVHVCGETASRDFPAGEESFRRTFDGNWIEYGVSLRIRVDADDAELCVRQSHGEGTRRGRYGIVFSQDSIHVFKESPNSVFREMGRTNVNFTAETWHNVHVASSLDGLAITLNDELALVIHDRDPLIMGGVSLNVGPSPHALAYFDDLLITNNTGVILSEDFGNDSLEGWSTSDGWAVMDDDGNRVLRGQSTVDDEWEWADTPWVYDAHDWRTDAFVVTLDADLANLLGGTFLGGSDNEWANAVAVDASGSVYVGGWTWSRDFHTTEGAFSRGFAHGHVGFVSKLDEDLGVLQASTLLGGSGESVEALAVGGDGSVYAAGHTWGDLPVTPEAYDRTHNGSRDAFVARLTGDLSDLMAATFIGGGDMDEAYALALAADGSVYVAGITSSSDFPTTGNAYAAGPTGDADGFVVRLDDELSRPPQPILQIVPATHNFGHVLIGMTANKEFTIVNTGRLPLTMGTITLTNGLDVSQFTIVDDLCSGRTLDPFGATTGTFSVVFTPSSLFGKAVVLRIPSNDPEKPIFEAPVYGSGRDMRTAEVLFHEGLSLLSAFNRDPHATSDLLSAHAKFMAALAADPAHQGACLFGAMTRLATVVHDPDVENLLTDFGMPMEGRNLWDWTAAFGDLGDGSPMSGQALDLLLGKLLEAIGESLDQLGRIPPGWTGSIVFSPDELPIDNEVQIDAGDIQMFQSGLELVRAILLMLRAHDLDFDFKHLDHLDTPRATIAVDGAPGDWSGVPPLHTDAQDDNLGGPSADIYRTFTAMDETYAYLMVETYGKPIHPDAVISFFLNYKPGRNLWLPDLPTGHDCQYDDLAIRFSADGVLFAGDTNTVTLTGVTVARGDVFEARIPLSELGNPDYFTATYVNIWPFGLPPEPPGDPTNIEPNPSAYLDAYPRFGTITNAAAFAHASNAIVRTIGFYLAGSELIRNETDFQTDDLIIFDPETLEDERIFRHVLGQVRDSILGVAASEFKVELSQFIDLGHFFRNPVAARDLLTGAGLRGFLVDHVLYQAERALSNLAAVGENYNERLLPGESFVETEVEVDYGDICMARAGLNALKAVSLYAAAYDLDCNLVDLAGGEPDTINTALQVFPQFLTVVDASRFAPSSNALASAADWYLEGSDSIRNETDDQGDDLIVFDEDTLQRDADLRLWLAKIKASLSAPERFDAGALHETVHLGRLFLPTYLTRELLPEFASGNTVVIGTFADPTFSGILPQMTQEKLSRWLQGMIMYGPAVTGLRMIAPGQWVLTWDGDAVGFHRIRATTNLLHGFPEILSDWLPAGDGCWTGTLHGTEPQRFFRLEVNP